MRTRALLALLALSALGLGVAACASVEPPAPVPTPSWSPETSGAPQPVAGYDWFYTAEPETARLAYGLAESDDLKLGFDCRRAGGQLEIVAIAGAGAPAEIHVESGGETERFPATAEPSEVNDGVFLSAAASTTEPVFQRFRRVGWMAQWRDGAREVYAPHPGTAADIERFFAFCG